MALLQPILIGTAGYSYPGAGANLGGALSAQEHHYVPGLGEGSLHQT